MKAKTILIAFLAVVSSTLGFAQSVDNFSEISNIRLSLAGQTIEVRPPREWDGWDQTRQQRIRKTLEGAFIAVGAQPTWSTDEILREADDLNSLSGNRWVDQSTLPVKGLAVGRYVAEFTYKVVARQSDLEAWLGRWGSGSDIAFDTRSSRFVLQLLIRDRHNGGRGVGYNEELGIARDIDNGLVAVSKLFGNNAGIRLSEEGDDARDERAQDKAAKKIANRIKKQYS